VLVNAAAASADDTEVGHDLVGVTRRVLAIEVLPITLIKLLATGTLHCRARERVGHPPAADLVSHVLPTAAGANDSESRDHLVRAAVHVLTVEVLHLIAIKQLAGRVSGR